MEDTEKKRKKHEKALYGCEAFQIRNVGEMSRKRELWRIVIADCTIKTPLE